MMIFKKAIPRRSFLRGVGSVLALPLLDGMLPAFAGTMDTAAKPALRVGFVYVPNGIIIDRWTPAKEGAEFSFTPTLEPLVPFREHLLVLTGLAQDMVSRQPGDAGGDHPRAASAWLTGVHPKKRGGDRGISIDQIISRHFAKETQLASLELSLDTTDLVAITEDGYSVAYTNTIAWSSANTPMLMENNPRQVFERLFGDSESTDKTERLTQIRENRSILDFVSQAAGRFMADLGPSDRAKVSEYLDSIRDIERRIQVAEQQSTRELPTFEHPSGIPANFEEHAKLMFDLQVLAYQCDLTRVITFMMSREKGERAYPQIGISEGHHSLSHHGNKPEVMATCAKIDAYHAKLFGYYLEKLQSTADGDGSLLDHMMLVYGSGLGDGNMHQFDNLGTLLAGGAVGQIQPGRHLRYPDHTPLMNLYLTMMDKLRMPLEHFGDSTGELNLLPIA
jgi:hypothetical protein